MQKLIGLSLFANIGVAEAYLDKLGIKVAVANELLEERARFYSDIYPNTDMICGDITDEKVFSEIMKKSKESNVNFIIATPPCQGMSTVGKQDPNDSRNYLITYALKAIKLLKPKFVLLENVPQQLKTKIRVNGDLLLIPDYIKKSVEKDYTVNNEIVSAIDYGVPQMRHRSIYLLVRKDIKVKWEFLKDEEKSKIVTLKEAIGDLPSLDPNIQGFSKEDLLEVFPDFEKKKVEGLKVSKWHFPPTHKFRHVEVMIYTPEGCSALKNKKHYPQKSNGARIKGFDNTYKRQWWDKPGYTITTYNGAICSQDNVHPGRYIGKDKDGNKMYSDPRALSIYELMLIMSLPKDWPIPSWASESLIRHAIGEGIPSLIIEKLFVNLLKEIDKADE